MTEQKCYIVYCTHYHSNSKRYLCDIPNVGAEWSEKIWKKNQFIPTIFKSKAEASRYVCGKTKDFETETNVSFTTTLKNEELKNVEGYAEIHALRFELDEKDLILRLKALAFDNNVIIGKKAKKEKQKVTKFSLDIKDTKKSSEWDILNLNKK